VRVDGASEQGPAPRVVRGAAPRDGDKGKAPSTRKRPPAEPIDLNTATEAQLLQLPDIGSTLAARILEARRVRKFTSVEELRQVKGIGPKRLESLRPHVRVGR
jgi:competence protein ComEA